MPAPALPRGPHALSRADVRASQRTRLLQAMLDLVGRDGYATTTVPAVIAAAHVSRNAFYELFRNKEECFLAMIEDQAGRFSAEVLANAMRDARDWMDAVCIGIRASLEWWRGQRALARAFFLDMPAVMAAERAAHLRAMANQPFEELLREAARVARLEAPDLPPLRESIPRLLIIAITESIAEQVRAGRAAHLSDLEGDLTHMTLTLLGGNVPQRHPRKAL